MIKVTTISYTDGDFDKFVFYSHDFTMDDWHEHFTTKLVHNYELISVANDGASKKYVREFQYDGKQMEDTVWVDQVHS